MKLASTLTLAALLLLQGAAFSVESKTYQLDYIGTGGNVFTLTVDDGGKLMSKPVQLTKGGNYDSFVMSPDGKRCVAVRQESAGSMKYSCYLDGPSGKGPVKIADIYSDGYPDAYWDPKGRFVLVSGGQVDVTTIWYDLSKSKVMRTTENRFSEVSPDGMYILEGEDFGDKARVSRFWILRLSDGKRFVGGSVWHKMHGAVPAWLPDRPHKFVAVRPDRLAWIGDVQRSGSILWGRTDTNTKFDFAERLDAESAGVSQLGGQQRSVDSAGYTMPFVRSVPPQNAALSKWADGAGGQNGIESSSASPDGRMFACAVNTAYDSNETPGIRIAAAGAQGVDGGSGRCVNWRGSPSRRRF